MFFTNERLEAFYKELYVRLNDAIQLIRKAVAGRDVLFTLKVNSFFINHMLK